MNLKIQYCNDTFFVLIYLIIKYLSMSFLDFLSHFTYAVLIKKFKLQSNDKIATNYLYHIVSQITIIFLEQQYDLLNQLDEYIM